jgi:outer membrane protein assembly factor BamB
VFSGAVASVVTAVIALEFLATESPYLAYQLGAPALEQRDGDVALFAAGAALLVAAAWSASRADARRMTHHRASALLASTALAAGVVFFVHVNCVYAQGRMVRAIVALDRQSGEEQWRLQGLDGPQPAVDGRNSPATPTPVTDGRVVCAYFGTPGLMCADAAGRLVWSRNDLGYDGFYGVGFSPILVDGTILIAGDTPAGIAHIHALDAHSGASRWTRTFETTATVTGNSRTPIVAESGGRQVLIIWGMHYVKAFALATGEPAWSHQLVSDGDIVSSAISDGERLYLSSKAGTVALEYAALEAGRDPLRWSSTARANCVSPVLVNGLLFTVTDAGIATAIDARTGETRWKQRLPGHYFASLLATPEAVYFTNSDGLTTVVGAEPSFRLIAENDLDGLTMASMAAARGVIYIRSANSLYAIGRTKADTVAIREPSN